MVGRRGAGGAPVHGECPPELQHASLAQGSRRDFSAATSKPLKALDFWDLAIRRRLGYNVSPTHWRRKKDEAHITISTKTMTIPEMLEQVRLVKKQYRKAKHDSRNERVKFLNNLPKKRREAILRREQQRELAWAAKKVTGKTASKSVTKIEINGQECSDRKEMESKLLQVNESKISACENTPFLQQPLLQDFGYNANTPQAEQVLNGTYQPPPLTNKYAKKLLQALQKPHAVSSIPIKFQPKHKIMVEELIRGWRRAKEATSAGMSGIHFGMYKAHTKRHQLAELDASMRSLAFQTGFSYKRW